MKRRQRIEIHYASGRIEQADSLRRAQEIIRAHPEEAVEVWLVSANDVGIGSRIAGPQLGADRPLLAGSGG
jgi:hypothetical protein